ncbi:hypothetical protein SADUNF_Sadunf08G0017800 [Salix dunnii]|uniref:Uncharacterized protein n=1 Tax=Salix dunnii TaxID=1413687 RepID=A0A835JUV4_9ROSI|nr:hypothetical protein SADUNF_Sadunf08G0017800 [Salix dunnii]
MASKQFHLMMFPWLAFGHMIPLLELSKKLASKGIRVSFYFATFVLRYFRNMNYNRNRRVDRAGLHVSFLNNYVNFGISIDPVLAQVPSNLANHLKFVEVLLPFVDGLPENCQATIDLQLNQIQYLKKAFDGLQASFEKLVHEDLAYLILFDFIQCWIPGIATKFGVP